MKTRQHKSREVPAAILTAAAFLVIFLLSYLTPLIADDYNYTMGYASDSRIRSLSDIWQSMAWHRQLLNGRVFAHGWVSLVLMYPRWVFAVLNGMVAALFTWTTESFFREHGSQSTRSTLCVLLLTWICMPGFGQIFLWTSGACNYFWGITLAWIIIRIIFRYGDQGPGLRDTLLMLVPAFAAGAWSEHISFAMLMVLFLHAVRRYHATGRIIPGEICLLLSGSAGYLYLMLAPASKLTQRMHDAGDPTEDGNLSRIISAVPGGMVTIVSAAAVFIILYLLLRKTMGRRRCHMFFLTGMFFLCMAAAVFSGIWAFRTGGVYGLISSATTGFSLSLSIFFAALTLAIKEKTDAERILLAVNLFFSGMCAFALFLFGEYLPARAFCAPVLLTLLAAVLLSDGLTCLKTRRRLSILILTASFAVTLMFGVSDIVTVYRASVVRENAFREAAEGNKILTTFPYPCRSKYSAQYGNADLAPDADWPNGIMADYYGVERIIVETPR